MTDEWYFDLRAGRAVPADERGPAKDLLGPYPSKAAAENWRQTHEEHEAAWTAADDEAGDEEEGDGEEGDGAGPA